METQSKNLWKQIARQFPIGKNEAAIASSLFRQYETQGVTQQSLNEVLLLGLPVIANFFHRISLMHSTESPILRRRDTRWMSEFDYTLVNIRATGSGSTMGTFVSASIFLASVKSQAIVLAPITQGASEKLEYIESHIHIRPELADPILLEAGFDLDLQMKAFCEAAHLLGFTIGYELDYRVDPLATVVFHKPEYFLWTHDGNLPSDEATQDSLRHCIREKLSSFGDLEFTKIRESLRTALVESSLVPSLSEDGSGRTPLSFQRLDGKERETAIRYWYSIFDYWREQYKFDFLVLAGTRMLDESDREVPSIGMISKVALAARKGGVCRNIGVVAEGHKHEVEKLGIHGIDLVLAQDAQEKTDQMWFQEVFNLDKQLRQINLGRKLKFSVPIYISSGEKCHVAEQKRALIKRFVARFFGTGPSRRPIWETMGTLEGAWGYEQALKQAINLKWPISQNEPSIAENIDSVATSFQKILNTGKLIADHVNERSAWWIIKARQSLLLAIVSVENEKNLPPEPFDIAPFSYHEKSARMTLFEYDFMDSNATLHLGNNILINTSTIPYGEFRLYVMM